MELFSKLSKFFAIQILVEKERFRKNPHNYAIKKTQLLKQKEMAEGSGDMEKAAEMQTLLDDLEERAVELDRVRSGNVSSIRYINQRNRDRNIKESEKALKDEIEAQKGAAADPFTRRNCIPTLVTKLTNVDQKAVIRQRVEDQYRMELPDDAELRKDLSYLPSLQKKKPTEVKMVASDNSGSNYLFNVHDFDITIDLGMPGTSAGNSVVKPTLYVNTAPRRSLNLKDYKKCRGLI
jgi:RNA polymerase-associated protein RTF1